MVSQDHFLLRVYICTWCVTRFTCILFVVSDQGSTYSGDLESEAPLSISTPLSWEEESNPAPSSQRGGGPVAVDPPSTSEPGAMDLEADIPTGEMEVLLTPVLAWLVL